MITDPCYLHTPVQQDLRPDVGFLSADVVSETAERHQLCNNHHSLRHTDRKDADTVLVVY